MRQFSAPNKLSQGLLGQARPLGKHWIGDLNGATEKLDYLNDGDPQTTSDLGIKGIWLMPIFPSPSYHGYDVTDYQAINPEYGTLDNFKRLLVDPDALPAMGVTLKFALISIPLGLCVPLYLAILVNSKRLRGSSFFRTLFYLPYVIPVVAGAIIFNGVMNAQSGWLNLMLKGLGITDPPRWFSDPVWAGFALNLLAIWGVGRYSVVKF